MMPFEGKTVLVTGATGLIGSHIVDTLMQMENVNVVALSRSEQKLRSGFADYMKLPNFHYISQDAAKPLQVDELSIDYIFHAAGSISGDIIKAVPVDVIKPNLIGTINLLELLRLQKIRTGKDGKIIIFSSATVYSNYSGKELRVSESDTNIAEDLDSLNAPYSQSKRMVEVIAKAYQRQYNLNVVIARFGYVYGYTRFPPNTAFYSFICKVMASENIIIQNSALPRRDNIYIDDAISGLLTVCLAGGGGESYNISSNAELGNFLSADEIAGIIIDEMDQQYGGSSKLVLPPSQQKQRKAGVILDNTKLKSLGWTLKVNIREGIRRTLEQYVEI